jgi:hypothetical protein
MRTQHLPIVVAAIAGLAGLACTDGANACSYTDLRNASPVAHAQFSQFAGAIKAAAPGLAASAAAPDNLLMSNPRRSIVGFWKFAFTAPDGSPIDWGFQTWHDDGTEITNSGGQLPATGNFCTGVFEQHVGGAYHLNHWAIAWNLPGTDPSDLAGLVNIREVVSVDRSGNAMTGSVSLDFYAPDGTTFLAHIGDGTVSATRINP